MKRADYKWLAERSLAEPACRCLRRFVDLRVPRRGSSADLRETTRASYVALPAGVPPLHA